LYLNNGDVLELSVVIPCYNEEKRIENTIKAISNYLISKKYLFEIIVIDDASKDNSVFLLKNKNFKKLKILKNKLNMGKGYSVRKGILNAKYSAVLFSDADLATPIEELENMVKYLKQKYDIVIASRNMAESKILTHQPYYRILMGKIFVSLVKFIAIKEFEDTQCGFKLFKTNVAKRIFKLQTRNRFSFDVEVLYIAQKHKYKVKEVPVKWINKEGSTVSPIKDSIRMFKDLLIIRFNDLRKRYNY